LFFTSDTTTSLATEHKKLPTGTKAHIMYRHFVLRPAAVWSAVAIAGILALLPARAQQPSRTPAAAPAATAQRPPTCVVAADQARFDFPLCEKVTSHEHLHDCAPRHSGNAHGRLGTIRLCAVQACHVRRQRWRPRLRPARLPLLSWTGGFDISSSNQARSDSRVASV
jgi:hypothetical protein